LETTYSPAIDWDINILSAILYLGIGASVICFLIWNIAISKLGAGRTALFGNLIPIFSSAEAAILLHEDFSIIHFISLALVLTGILLANRRLSK
jgi:drug/metabolite transporter (DMT)-like permease